MHARNILDTGTASERKPGELKVLQAIDKHDVLITVTSKRKS